MTILHFRDSGLYDEPFFKKIKHLGYLIVKYGLTYIKYDRELYRKYFGDEDIDDDELDEILTENLCRQYLYFEPEIFDEEIAYRCKLTPFTYSKEKEELELLALRGYSADLSPKLDAYQVLTSGTIDKDSKLFTQTNYFENIVGKALTQEVMNKLTK